jgi:hypothetical protein
VSAPDRLAYGERQARLLEALLRGEAPPAGFAADKAAASGSSLRRKRAHAVARAWPALALALGDEFASRFDAYARAADLPASGDPLEDGLEFARSHAGGGPLPDDVRVEMLLARAALRRHGLFARAAWLRRPLPRLLVVVRLPWLGARHLALGAPRMRR